MLRAILQVVCVASLITLGATSDISTCRNDLGESRATPTERVQSDNVDSETYGHFNTMYNLARTNVLETYCTSKALLIDLLRSVGLEALILPRHSEASIRKGVTTRGFNFCDVHLAMKKRGSRPSCFTTGLCY